MLRRRLLVIMGREVRGTLGAPAQAALEALKAARPDLVHTVTGAATRIGILLPDAEERPQGTPVDMAETELDRVLPWELAGDPALGRFCVYVLETDRWLVPVAVAA